MSERTIYVSGPMTGLPEFNYPAFNAVACALREQGWVVENPAENDPPPSGYEGEAWVWFMKASLVQLSKVDNIVLLPAWSRSAGARTEVVVGLALGYAFWEWHDGQMLPGYVPDIRYVANFGAGVAS